MTSTTPATASLTERRKAATRMEIARAAAGLFVAHGLKATRAEDIAQAAGIAPRTFYRYCATKEEAVAPLYAAGAQRWVEAVREAPPALPLPDALAHAVHHTLVPGQGVSAASWEWVRTLIRLAEAVPALGKVWAEVCQASEESLARVLAERLTGAQRHTGAQQPTGEGGEGDSGVGDAGQGGVGMGHAGPGGVGMGQAGQGGVGAAGLGPAGTGTAGVGAAGVGAAGVGNAGVTPHLRFGAAVVSAAVRVAVQSWAVNDTPATAPDGPAALALRNLEALRGFAWEPERT
ncbi:TetR/AcrR family transcriptional regulator [Streptomyces sp. DSM 15324]|uniref:TetR/AcrR family transcriptional regulator n=1 Tax=Streptomyces sp. DSM 15324 TaxID=1739111 RepID=UPI001F278162|nr:TetR/AcrR family transcriptional regulator [Streptomyces sp. DSM 15324]